MSIKYNIKKYVKIKIYAGSRYNCPICNYDAKVFLMEVCTKKKCKMSKL